MVNFFCFKFWKSY